MITVWHIWDISNVCKNTLFEKYLRKRGIFDLRAEPTVLKRSSKYLSDSPHKKGIRLILATIFPPMI